MYKICAIITSNVFSEQSKTKAQAADHKSPRRKILVLASVVMTFDLYQKKVLSLHKVELHGVTQDMHFFFIINGLTFITTLYI